MLLLFLSLAEGFFALLLLRVDWEALDSCIDIVRYRLIMSFTCCCRRHRTQFGEFFVRPAAAVREPLLRGKVGSASASNLFLTNIGFAATSIKKSPMLQSYLAQQRVQPGSQQVLCVVVSVVLGMCFLLDKFVCALPNFSNIPFVFMLDIFPSIFSAKHLALTARANLWYLLWRAAQNRIH